jgi:hypothetical protein
MKTTGVLPEALAASISRFSRSEIDAMTNSPPVGRKSTRSLRVSLFHDGLACRFDSADVGASPKGQ